MLRRRGATARLGMEVNGYTGRFDYFWLPLKQMSNVYAVDDGGGMGWRRSWLRSGISCEAGMPPQEQKIWGTCLC